MTSQGHASDIPQQSNNVLQAFPSSQQVSQYQRSQSAALHTENGHAHPVPSTSPPARGTPALNTQINTITVNYKESLPTYDDYESIPISSVNERESRGGQRPYARSLHSSEDVHELKSGATPHTPRSHQRTISELLPFTFRSPRSTTPQPPSPLRSTQTSRASSPVKQTHSRHGSDGIMPFTGDTRRPGPDTLGRTLSSWVTETAAATVNKVVGSAQKSSPLVKTALKQDRVRRDSSATIEAGVPGTPTPGATDDTGQSAKSQIIQPKTPTSSTPTFGKAAFASLFGGQKPAAIPASLDTEADELCTLDIGQFLPVPQASQQPTAAEMKMMHDNATKMLNRFQNGYRKRIGQIHDLRAEGEAKDEELEGESVRNKSLRAQLEAMSRTVLERDETLKQFMDELAAKSGIIDELNVARRAEEEDLEVEKRLAHKRETRDRHSSVSATTLSTLDTDGESLYDPVFSRTISRATTPLSPTNETTPKAARSSRASAVSVLSDDMDDSLDTIRPSGGVAAKPVAKSIRTVYKCDNCQGKDSNYAWKALGTVREEKQRLESRCHELEVATDEVLALLKIGT